MSIIWTGVQQIGPEDARQILVYNTRNRRINPRELAKIVRAMESYAWRETGEAIQIFYPPHGGTPVLLDGQKRLTAIVKTETSHRFVITHLDEDIFDLIDGGEARTLRQIIEVDWQGQRDSSHGNAVCTALAIAFTLIPQGQAEFNLLGREGKYALADFHSQLHAWGMDLCGAIRAGTGKRTPQAGMLAGMIALCDQWGMEQVNPFAAAVSTADQTLLGDSARILHDAIATGKARDVSTGGKDIHPAWYELVIRAWNFYCVGKRNLTRIKITGAIPHMLPPPTRGMYDTQAEDQSLAAD